MKENGGLVITIDGPAGAGKSTVSKLLAKRLNYIYLDTGALYRAVAYEMIRKGIGIDKDQILSNFLKSTKLTIDMTDDRMKVLINNEDVTDHIRSEEIGLMASKISTSPVVRAALLAIQQKAGKEGALIAEGRDMGTVVFPDADIKFFLDAHADERIKRRHREFIDKGLQADLEIIERDLSIRDRQDRERSVAPLKVPEGAIVIDSSKMNIADVVENMMNFIHNKIKR